MTFSVEVIAAAATLSRHPDYRLLRRLITPDRASQPGIVSQMLTGCALDVETTGVDSNDDAIIELAMRRFQIDDLGRVMRVGRRFSWLEDPKRKLSPEIVRLTGLDDDILKGRSIIDAEAVCVLRDSDFVTSHNARFDRAFVEKRLPDAAGLRWACSLNDVDWRALGFEGRSLPHLLMQAGWFYDAHRASADVDALIRLLDHPLVEGGTVARRMIRTAATPSVELEAAGAPFSSRGALKARGWRWAPDRKAWQREVLKADFDREYEWAISVAYLGQGRPTYRELDWSERYSLR